MEPAAAIRWPARYAPGHTPVHVRNELAMDVPPERVWAWLIRAQRWPTWYENSANVRILSGRGPDLSPDARFRWRTFGVPLLSHVVEFVPGERIAWLARGLGVDAYHAWIIQPTPGGSLVLTEETQHGWLARLSALLMPRRMGKYHQIWLERLRDVARSGLPPPA